MNTKICKRCKKELPIENFTKSKAVKDGYENKCKKCRNEERLKHKCICVTCGKEWMAQKKDAKYCSPECKPQCQQKRIIVKCSICGKEKEVNEYRIKHQKDFYCSDDCKNKGYSLKYTGENKKKYKKIKCNCDICNKQFILNECEFKKYNHHYCSKECRYKGMSVFYSGENHPSYNHNKPLEERLKDRKYIEYYERRKNVYEKDNYTCQCCGDNKGHNLVAHHILNYSEHEEIRTNINNGITLCKTCHKLFHDIYGYRNNNKNQLDEFMKEHGNQLPTN